MAKVYYEYKGVPVVFPKTEGEEFDKFISDNEHLVGHEVNKAAYNARVQELADEALENNGPRANNVRKMLIKSVDALLSQANQDRLQGKDLVAPLDKVVDAWLQLPGNE